METIKHLLEYIDYFNLTFANLPDWLVTEDFCIRAIKTDVKYFFKIPKELITENISLEALISFNDDDPRFKIEDIHNYMPGSIAT